jgi:hypothetical protein
MANNYAIEDIANMAARAGGVQKRIGEIYEGSELSKVALELWQQTRQELLQFKDWYFNRRANIALTLLKGPPPDGGYNPIQPWNNTYPAPGYLYEYAYPADCLELRAIIPMPIGFMPDSDPLPSQWRVDDDQLPNVVDGVATGPEAKVILTNTTNAMAVYRADVTNVTLWEPNFVAAFVASLGKKFAKAFGAEAAEIQSDVAEEGRTLAAGNDLRG